MRLAQCCCSLGDLLGEVGEEHSRPALMQGRCDCGTDPSCRTGDYWRSVL